MELPNGKGQFSLQSFPGISLFADLSSFTYASRLKVVPGVTPSADRLFAISAGDLLEISSAGAPTDRGNITSGSAPAFALSGATTAGGGKLLLTGNGAAVYSYDLATDALSSAISGTPTLGIDIGWLDGYFIIPDSGTQRFYISALNDGSTWAGDFGSAESDPDGISSMLVDHGELWLAGRNSIQPFRNTGNADFPFEPVSARIEYGVLPGSMKRHDNAIHFIGTYQGTLSVFRVEGYQPVRISTHAIDERLSALVGPISSKCFSFAQEGHAFYVISSISVTSGSGLSTSPAYDSSTGEWTEWAHWQTGETFTNLGIADYAYAYGKHLVCIEDANFKGIYQLSDSVFTDVLAPAANTGDTIKWLRRAPHLTAALQQTRYNRLELDGSGFNDLELKYSNNGGTSYSSAISANGGRPFWVRLGSGRDRVFQVTGTLDGAGVNIAQAYLDAEPGMH